MKRELFVDCASCLTGHLLKRSDWKDAPVTPTCKVCRKELPVPSYWYKFLAGLPF